MTTMSLILDEHEIGESILSFLISNNSLIYKTKLIIHEICFKLSQPEAYFLFFALKVKINYTKISEVFSYFWKWNIAT